MPLWLIFHPPETTFTTPEEKAALAESITAHYQDVIELPAFYVVVQFIAVPASSCFVGGVARSSCPSDPPFVRITVDHIARRNATGDPAAYKRTAARLDALLRPHTKDKGYDYEFHVDETEKRLWMVNGLVPPEAGSEGEKLWKRLNRPVPYEDG